MADWIQCCIPPSCPCESSLKPPDVQSCPDFPQIGLEREANVIWLEFQQVEDSHQANAECLPSSSAEVFVTLGISDIWFPCRFRYLSLSTTNGGFYNVWVWIKWHNEYVRPLKVSKIMEDFRGQFIIIKHQDFKSFKLLVCPFSWPAQKKTKTQAVLFSRITTSIHT